MHSEEPRQPLEPQLWELLKGATSVDIAVAFVSEFGAKVIRSIVARLHGRALVRLIVSVLFPTNLDAIQELAQELAEKIEVWVHLAYQDQVERLHGQFH